MPSDEFKQRMREVCSKTFQKFWEDNLVWFDLLNLGAVVALALRAFDRKDMTDLTTAVVALTAGWLYSFGVKRLREKDYQFFCKEMHEDAEKLAREVAQQEVVTDVPHRFWVEVVGHPSEGRVGLILEKDPMHGLTIGSLIRHVENDMTYGLYQNVRPMKETDEAVCRVQWYPQEANKGFK